MRRLWKILLTAVLGCLISRMCQAQQSDIQIIGRVIDAKDSLPLAGATVYLSNTTIGTTTTEQGTFSLKNIPRGSYKLVASYIGYKTFVVALTNKDNDKIINMVLQEDTGRLKEIIVRSKRIRKGDRQRYLTYFKKGFIGTDDNAKYCKILNPNVLYYNLDEQSGIMTAFAKAPLIIENKALGYRIYYELESFSLDLRNYHTTYFGYPRFEALSPKNERQQERWDDNRRVAYLCSMRRFMLLLANRQLEQYHIEMNKLIRTESKKQNRSHVSVSFGINSDPLKDLGSHVEDSLFPQQAPYDSVIHHDTKVGLVKLAFHNSLRIRMPQPFSPRKGMTVVTIHDRYKEKPNHTAIAPNMISVITMTKPGTYIDPNGMLTDPLAISVEGAWAQMQVADVLPFEYRPGE